MTPSASCRFESLLSGAHFQRQNPSVPISAVPWSSGVFWIPEPKEACRSLAGASIRTTNRCATVAPLLTNFVWIVGDSYIMGSQRTT